MDAVQGARCCHADSCTTVGGHRAAAEADYSAVSCPGDSSSDDACTEPDYDRSGSSNHYGYKHRIRGSYGDSIVTQTGEERCDRFQQALRAG
jgi:hypothetical protein